MGRLSELWFKFTDTISTVIFSFIFFWGAIIYLIDTDGKIIHYLNHLSYQTGNDAFSSIKTLVIVFSIIIGYILIVMPFSVIGILIRGNKVGDKKQYILRFLLRSILFWRIFFL